MENTLNPTRHKGFGFIYGNDHKSKFISLLIKGLDLGYHGVFVISNDSCYLEIARWGKKFNLKNFSSFKDSDAINLSMRYPNRTSYYKDLLNNPNNKKYTKISRNSLTLILDELLTKKKYFCILKNKSSNYTIITEKLTKEF